MKRLFQCLSLMLILLSIGCIAASKHRNEVQDNSDKVTVGTVQKEIHVGMSGAEVIEVLGSPNIVSTDEQRREVWVYDKISTETAYSKSSGGIGVLILGFGSDTGAVSKTQKTLTIIIKYDEKGLVRDFAYHTTRF
nr:hypothetical protein [uncultured Desulfobacter sp.]